FMRWRSSTSSGLPSKVGLSNASTITFCVSALSSGTVTPSCSAMSQSSVQSPPEIVTKPTPRSCLSGRSLAPANSAVVSIKSSRLFRRRFEVGRDDVDLRALSLIGQVVGGVEHDLVAAAGADVKTQAPFDPEVHQQIHHAAALKNAADVAGADILWQLAAPYAELGTQRDKSHTVGAEQFQIRRLG